jgi:trehalose 6-phosphate phosphatase
MLDAHCAFELKSLGFDKGKAVAAFLSKPPFRERTPIFIGDDDTDEAGFAVVAARGGCAYSVGRPRPGVVATFANPSEVRVCLAAFARGGVPA